jgi:Protein of unknown function (DUF2721)
MDTIPISINTPALLFPAISLLLLAYTNRFLAIANLVRGLHEKYNKKEEVMNKEVLALQIRNLRRRLVLIRYMQSFGVFSFLLCVVCMYCIYNNWTDAAKYIFALSLLSLVVSLFISLMEIMQSTYALEVQLHDLEDKEGGFLDELFSRTRK